MKPRYPRRAVAEVKTESRERVLHILDKLGKTGAQGVVLGCTKLPPGDSPLPLFNTTQLHAQKSLEFALQD